jgi:hypothetical protein
VRSASRLVGIVFVALALSAAGPVHSTEVSAAFPGESAELASPNGTMKVVNHDPDDNDHPHTLVLSGAGSHDRTLLEYGRHVRVGWAPNSQHLFVTDYTESTDTTCLLFNIENKDSIDLRELAKKFSAKTRRLLSQSHAYLECEHWLSNDRILVKLRGWNASRSSAASLLLEYRLTSGYADASLQTPRGN